MPPISVRAIVIAIAAEVAADWVVGVASFLAMAGDALTPGMSEEEIGQLTRQVFETTAYVPWMMVFGSATTVGGAYLAARIAQRIPYYHGLAMGIVGIVLCLVLWPPEADWSHYLGLLMTIPLSIFGAHLARNSLKKEHP